VDAGSLIRQSRLKAGLTQTELATRLGTTQSAVARLEGRGSNPRVETLSSALRATGQELDLRVRASRPRVDETQIRERLKLTPAARLAAFQASSAKTRQLLAKAKPPRARPA
jgi:transcriptional regulator with XRE-family HTH domain